MVTACQEQVSVTGPVGENADKATQAPAQEPQPPEAAAASADTLNLDVPADALEAMRKVQCSTIDNKPVTYHWFGRAYSRRMGERDRNIFNVEGMNVRSCKTIVDENRGLGYKLVSREILLYQDVETGEVLKTWENPWTGEEVTVMHVANDPVNFESFVKGRDGRDITFGGDILGDKFQMSLTVPLFYHNPLGSEFQSEVGGTYHATEMFNFFGDVDDLLDRNTDTARTAVGWARMSDWLPWMKMAGRDGIIYMHTAGRKLNDWDELSETMKSEIRNHYPEYVGPPDPDDPRDNMTSWKYYKAVKQGEIELPKRQD
ncbi:MAG: DUF1838 family protein [Hyphomonadaceae bacterium]|nr:DUF1838 family protein [Hyphomonadaceae bacterium]